MSTVEGCTPDRVQLDLPSRLVWSYDALLAYAERRSNSADEFIKHLMQISMMYTELSKTMSKNLSKFMPCARDAAEVAVDSFGIVLRTMANSEQKVVDRYANVGRTIREDICAGLQQILTNSQQTRRKLAADAAYMRKQCQDAMATLTKVQAKYNKAHMSAEKKGIPEDGSEGADSLEAVEQAYRQAIASANRVQDFAMQQAIIGIGTIQAVLVTQDLRIHSALKSFCELTDSILPPEAFHTFRQAVAAMNYAADFDDFVAVTELESSPVPAAVFVPYEIKSPSSSSSAAQPDQLLSVPPKQSLQMKLKQFTRQNPTPAKQMTEVRLMRVSIEALQSLQEQLSIDCLVAGLPVGLRWLAEQIVALGGPQVPNLFLQTASPEEVAGLVETVNNGLFQQSKAKSPVAVALAMKIMLHSFPTPIVPEEFNERILHRTLTPESFAEHVCEPNKSLFGRMLIFMQQVVKASNVNGTCVNTAESVASGLYSSFIRCSAWKGNSEKLKLMPLACIEWLTKTIENADSSLFLPSIKPSRLNISLGDIPQESIATPVPSFAAPATAKIQNASNSPKSAAAENKTPTITPRPASVIGLRPQPALVPVANDTPITPPPSLPPGLTFESSSFTPLFAPPSNPEAFLSINTSASSSLINNPV